jgi:hypothetical protein
MKQYPAFIIDRSRRSEASRFVDDFIVCTDKEMGFIARAYTLPRSRWMEFRKAYEALDEATQEHRYYFASIRNGEAHVVMEVERMLYEPIANWARLKPLLKKAMKAYLYGEIKEVSGDGRAIDLQISAVSDLLRTMESQRAQMIDRNGETATDNYINATRGAIESLKLLKRIYDNGREN